MYNALCAMESAIVNESVQQQSLERSECYQMTSIVTAVVNCVYIDHLQVELLTLILVHFEVGLG